MNLPMPTPAQLAARPKRASYSAISTHDECGASYMFSYIMKVPDPAGDAAARGTRLHTSGEMFLKGVLPVDKLPVDYWKVKEMMLQYKKVKAKSEETWCVDKSWNMCDESDPNILIKAVIDVHWFVAKQKELNVRDLKTGRIYQSHVDQLQLYGTLGMIRYPKAKMVDVAGTYIDQGKLDHQAQYPRKMLPMLIKRWDEKANAVLTDVKFDPKPSEDNCKWCTFNAKRKGGPCTAGV